MRKEKGLTQEEFGEKPGVTNKSVSRWETGKYLPDLDKIKEIAELLSVTVNELLSGDRIHDENSYKKNAEENLSQALSGYTYGYQQMVKKAQKLLLVNYLILSLFGLFLTIFGALEHYYGMLVIGLATLSMYSCKASYQWFFKVR